MEINFIEDEVFEAIKSLETDNTHGPDSFLVQIYQKSWFFMKREIMEFIKEFQEHGYLDWSLNTTFVTLIDKRR